MGIQADNMAEVFKRSNGDALTDLRTAQTVEFLSGPDGRIWVNVDGLCALRIQAVGSVLVDTTSVANLDKVIHE